MERPIYMVRIPAQRKDHCACIRVYVEGLMLGKATGDEEQGEREEERFGNGLHGSSPVVKVFLSVWSGMSDDLRQPKAEGGDLFVGQVFMSRHVGSGNSEFDDLRQTIHLLRRRDRRQ